MMWMKSCLPSSRLWRRAERLFCRILLNDIRNVDLLLKILLIQVLYWSTVKKRMSIFFYNCFRMPVLSLF
jgi:hypothetical protein